ncbi:hypothetical protein J5J10_06765 [Ciceribacter sp. L1K23]|uniref:hypothetical protein n=1 Tax=Ciceribacter sp. L1K23 TaxID=2820276 RepID=UPI001B82F73B|nr:hypothetical protein [Ciceribacter sp. L1K23]MBR0555379.1 hypothetical protein [Ciceribacter sp. L1K23]
MQRFLLRLLAIIAVVAVLPSCILTGREPIRRPLMYDVRDVAVIGAADVPLVVLAGVDRRVAAAVNATRRNVPLQRVVLTVKFDDYRPVQAYGDRRASVRFKVTAADIDTGNPVAAGTFIVHSSTDNPRIADENLAEEAAARIRFAFSLQTPRLPPPRPKPRTTSTKLKADAPAVAAPASVTAPAVVPAPTVAPAAAPVVPSGTNVEEGASGKITIGGGSTCDVATDPTCNP